MRGHRWFFAAALILAAGIASAVAFAPSAVEERAPESLLPADSVVYFGWDGTEKHKADWEKSAVYESLDKTKLLKTIVDFALSYIPADSPVPESAVRQLLSGIAARYFAQPFRAQRETDAPGRRGLASGGRLAAGV